jgi:hypothetical protein
MKGTWMVVAALSAAGLGSAPAWAGPTTSSELSVGYSFLRTPEYRGWNVSWTKAHDRRFAIEIDAAGYYAEGESAHVLGIAPRFRQGGKDLAVFEHVVIGVSMFGGDVVPAVFFYPGLGLDLAPERSVGVRLQVDCPLLVVSPYGSLFTFEAPRFSAAIVFRPGLGRPHAQSRPARRR